MAERMILNRWLATAEKLRTLDDQIFLNVASLALKQDVAQLMTCDRGKLSELLSPFMGDFITHPCHNTNDTALDSTPLIEFPDYEKYSVIINGRKFCYLLSDLFLWMNEPNVTMDPYRRFSFDDPVYCGLSHRAIIQLRVTLLSRNDVLANLVNEEESITHLQPIRTDFSLNMMWIAETAHRAGVPQFLIVANMEDIHSICQQLFNNLSGELLRLFNILYPQTMQLIINTTLMKRAFAYVHADELLIGYDDMSPQERPNLGSALHLQTNLWDYFSDRLVLSDQAISLLEYGFANMLKAVFQTASSTCKSPRSFRDCLVNITRRLPIRLRLGAGSAEVDEYFRNREGDNRAYRPDPNDMSDDDDDTLIGELIDDLDSFSV